MRRLILIGGRPWLATDGGKYFVDVLLRYFPTRAKIAFCLFAQPESDWEQTVASNKEMLSGLNGKRKLEYQTITTKNFVEVSKWADIIYIPGGDPYTLHTQIMESGDPDELWEGKVIAGSSAGADLMCERFVYLQGKTLGQGLGWIPATCVPHWRDDFNDYTQDDWDWAEREALNQFPELPVLCIPEGKLVELSVK